MIELDMAMLKLFYDERYGFFLFARNLLLFGSACLCDSSAEA